MFNKRTFLLLFLLIIAIGTVSSVAAGDLNNVTVGESNSDGIEVNENNVIGEPTADDGSNQVGSVDEISQGDESGEVLSANDGKSLSELQTLINNAARGSTITLTSDYYADSNSNYAGVLIEKPLTINGNGHIISGSSADGKTRVFYITSNNVVLNNIKLIEGYNFDKGGAICIECIGNALTTIKNCQFINNTAPHGGGAIVTNSRLRIEGCNFITNKAQAYDYDSVTGLYNKPAGFGGAIFAYYPLQGNQSVYIKDSYFEDNRASYLGGALYLSYVTGDGDIKTGDAESYIVGSTFYKNKATYGGAIANFQYCVISNTQFSENNALGPGGAIFMSDGVYGTIDDEEIVQIFYLMLTGNTKFEKNSASGGGAIGYLYTSDYYRSIGLCGVIRTDGNGIIFDSNSAQNGAALNIHDSDSIIKAKFIKNQATQGSVIYGGNIVDSTFTGNSNNLISEGNLIDTGYTSFKFEQSGTYYNDKTVTVTLTNTKRNMPIINTMVGIQFSNGEVVGGVTDANGKATYNVPFTVGTYSAVAAVLGGAVNVDPIQLNNIKIAKAPITITPTKLSTTYDSGKVFQVKVVNSKTNKPVSGLKLKLQVYTGSSSKTVTVTTDSKGIAKYTSASKLSVGTHKVIVSNAQTADCTGSKKTSSIVVSKASYNIVAPKVTNPYKVGNFKITVKNKASGKVVSGVSLTVKLYTGSSAKTVTVKTNSKGMATVSTTSLNKGNHKIVVSAKATKSYNAASKTSYANIVAKATTSISYSDLTYYNNPDTNSIVAVSANLILKDANGNPIKKTLTMKHSNGENGFYLADEDNVMAVFCDGTGTLTVKFAGDSKYKPSSCTIKL